MKMLEVIETNKDRFTGVMEKPENFDRLKMSFLSELNKNKKLADCSPASLAGCLMQVSQLGLDIGVVDEAYFVPYKGEATLQVSYKGLIKVAYNTGLVDLIRAEMVYKDDDFCYDIGKNKIEKHNPGESRKEPVGVYAEIKLKTGSSLIAYKTMDQIAESRKKSRGDQFWTNGFESMAKKVVIREAMKLLPKSKINVVDTEAVEIGKASFGLPSKLENRASIDAELLGN